MTNKIEDLKKKQYEAIMNSEEFNSVLKDTVAEIKSESLSSKNEATLSFVFESHLYNLINQLTGIKCYPSKEEHIGTVRHTAKGRIDSRFGALVIEFKHHSKLKSNIEIDSASEQLIGYLEGLCKNNQQDYIGILTDGVQIKRISLINDELIESGIKGLDYTDLKNIINTVVLLNKISLTPQNLVKQFCEDDNSLSKRLTSALFSLIINKPTNKTSMLINEWKELFRLAHDDKSKQSAIEKRRESLQNVIDLKLANNEMEYAALYSVQTAYAIIIKLIAYKVVSKLRFNTSIIDFRQISTYDNSALRLEMESLENGDIFRNTGIGNLLEGDFFSWYCDSEQWDDEVSTIIKDIINALIPYEDKALFEKVPIIQDLFKELYLSIIPDKVRHSLGEFYTPAWLADNVIENALEYNQEEEWKALDPCAGSGTFLTSCIKKVLDEYESKGLSNHEILKKVLNRVKGIDLNPLAVLTARINYFINISHLIDEQIDLEIPVYLGDASYVPQYIKVDNIDCIKYSVNTIKGSINIILPSSILNDISSFSKMMFSIENSVKNQDEESVYENITNLIDDTDKTEVILAHVKTLASKFVDLERNHWNGIWARIVANFLTTANIGKFDIIIGNPPWVEWKNLPQNYRDKLVDICIERHLFSGDGVTGGINLNVCALIANTASKNWLSEDGTLAFLMPQSILFQQSYEGFRDLIISDNKNLYFKEITDWTKAGHPFKPVQHKFVTFVINNTPSNYQQGIPVSKYIKKRNIRLDTLSHITDFADMSNAFDIKRGVIGHATSKSTIFSYANTSEELNNFRTITGKSFYKAREGIEFYPQEVFLLNYSNKLNSGKANANTVFVENYQDSKSKHKVPFTVSQLEKLFLFPLIKGVGIKRYHVDEPNYIVPFPYDSEISTREPINNKLLTDKSILLMKYLNKYKSVIKNQTEYNKKIIGTKYNKEFYALARVGEYSFADYFVAFRDNTKWQASVVTRQPTPWGGMKMPVFQNHAAYISQTVGGRFITEDEAYFICAILNAPIVNKYMNSSSDSRSFKINPQINIPEFSVTNDVHNELVVLCKRAHQNWDVPKEINEIDKRIDELILLL